MKTDPEQTKLNNFEEAFATNMSGCRRTCECGKEFYDPTGGWDWEDDELENLDNDPNATALDYSVGTVIVNGKEYVRDCKCWHEIAVKVMNFLDAFDTNIASYFKLEKSRVEEIAKHAVTIDILYDEVKDGWREMGSAPRNATTVEVLMHNRTTKQAHWAQDLSGEEQPAFRGWFEKGEHFNSQIEDPIAWRNIREDVTNTTS